MIEPNTNGSAASRPYSIHMMRNLTEPPPSAESCNHTVQFFTEDSFLESAVARFAVSALKKGDAVVVLATAKHRSAIGRLMLDEPVLSSTASCLLSIDAETTLARCLLNGRPDQSLFNEVIGDVITRAMRLAPHVSIYGELVALLSARGRHDHALELERFWHQLLGRYPVSLLCGYSMQSFATIADGEALQAICDAHDRVFPAEHYPAGASEDQRRRATAMLQQRLQALELEAEERERALEQRNAELLAALAARDQFLMAAAHELRTPITSLRVYSQLLQRDTSEHQVAMTDRFHAALQAIERQTDQINQLVNRLLDVGQIESGSLRVDLVDTDLVAIVRNALLFHERGGTHRFVLDAPEEVSARVDPVRLEQVITILLGNAVKFSPSGSLVTVAVTQNPDSSVELSVCDEGRGVANEERDAIFERNGHAREQRPLTGLGLSLPIARRIVELHGGTIRVDSTAERGARFVVTLPAPPTPR